VAKSWLVVLGGTDGGGKSYLAYNIAAGAVRQGKKVGAINFEMTQMQAATRYVSVLTGLPKCKLEQGKAYSPAAWQRATRRVAEIREETGGTFIINKASVFRLQDVNEAYAQLADAGCEAIITDYAQLIGVDGTGSDIRGRTETVANRLRELTHQHNVASFVLSQFNREMKLSESKPTRHGLQGGSAGENNANQIVLIDHTTQVINRERTAKYSYLIGDKNRHGLAPWELPFKWTFETMRAEEYVPGTDAGENVFPRDEDEGGVHIDTDTGEVKERYDGSDLPF
jgi:replicative DNA helicase